ncbi:discoidin domain-containing protein [Pseudopedobacter beijingensis]|uniref:glucan endo-1,3-beta-D-glucosidase n=1 Tax=Pseudopedobacter beijingensis TaxID=1207056 RepID=A0ABW4ICD0_9SPHI
MIKKIVTILLFAGLISSLYAQKPVGVGSGSYAEYTPLYKSRTAERGGDQSYLMENRKLYVTEKNQGKPIPTNDWWTDLLVSQYSGNLWSYPQVVNAEEYGFYVAYPKDWEPTGHELKWNSQIEVSAIGFKPGSADANNWHDWGLDFLMKDGEKEMLVTMAHGVPFTWVESKNLILQLKTGTGVLTDANGQSLTLPFIGSRLIVNIDGDIYGIFAPDGTVFSKKNGLIEVIFQNTSQQYLSIGVLPSAQDLDFYAAYAYTIPRNTTVDWNYNETTGEVVTNWNLDTENLKNETQKQVLQGFIPHHYKNSNLNFGFTGIEYLTPRGKMKMAIGSSFSITYKFNGILPFFANPLSDETLENPYQKERMKQMISDYANKGNFGGDTYWGGKGLIQMAMYMTFAHEMGETELFEKCKTRLKDVLINWLTYTPGENSFFFARYQRWGALIGYDTSYDSDTFNDHHFHYGYFTLASGILALFDEDFKNSYGEMAGLLAKEYANWDRNDNDFPFLRTLDPWAGHSYAGGLGGWDGNGQESTSEAMQGWGGVYMLGVATGNKAMRDAGIFGWTLEARGVAEYWFDRDKENIDYTRYTKPYNSNLTSRGIGWWTWFSGDPVWMHSIQWLPISPALKYLYEDLSYAEWDYTQMWNSKEIKGWETESGQQPSALSYESGVGNVVLSYLQIFNPDSAAAVFDRMWDAEMPIARNTDTGGISYFLTHSHRTYGDISWDIHADIPTATTYKHPVTGKYTYMVYNPDNSEKSIKFYQNGSQILEIKVPGKKLTVYSDNPEATTIEIHTENGNVVEPGTSVHLTAILLDQYGATMEGSFDWSVSGNGSVTNEGLFTASSVNGEAIVTATAGSLSTNITLAVNDLPKLETAVLLPENQNYIEKGKTVNFSLEMKDQYNKPYQIPVNWKILKGSEEIKADSVLDVQTIGIYTIQATAEGKTYSQNVYVTPKFRNIALGKQAYSSSEENAGTLTRYATDGDKATRWGSSHSDPQWIYIDLQQSSFIGYVSLLWEPAYASLYEIQVSDDEQNWETVKTVNGLGGTETTEINKTARYIRMYGLERATTYGYSLYEFEVYGIPPMDNIPVLFGIDVTPAFSQIKEGETINLTVKGYDQFGDEFPISPQFSIQTGEGDLSTEGAFAPTKYGKAIVQVNVGELTAIAEFIVEETIKLTTIEIFPKQTPLIIGENISFTAAAKDQFGIDFPDTELYYSIIERENGTITGNVFTSNYPGEYKITVSDGKGIQDTATIVVAEIEKVNLALHKPVYASSYENDGTLPQFVNDGNYNTRWGGSFKDNEYIQVDLQDNYVINKIKLSWDPAYAASYNILVSTDEENWTMVWSETAGKGGNEVIDIDPVGARYVRILCITRNTGYGSSINEMEIYGSAFWENPQPATITLNPFPLVAYINDKLEITANVLDQYSLPYTSEEVFSWSVNGGGTINQQGEFTPQSTGEYVLTVSYGTLTTGFPLIVQPQKVLTNLNISPDNILLKTGETQQFEAAAFDQYGNPMTINDISWFASGGTISTSGEFNATENGSFEITATVNGITSHISVEVFIPNTENIALRKATISSSGNSAAAVDGNEDSRWIAATTNNPEWFYVDLGAVYHISDLDILWERAAASDYEIQTSNDGINWITIANIIGKEDTGGNRRDVLRVQGQGKYLRVWCTKPATPWNFSVYELKAYGKFIAEEPLPVKYLSFDVKQQSEGVVLEWITAYEKNNSHFIIERSSEGINFEAIGELAGKVNSSAAVNYIWNDKNPVTGNNYYRLKQVDLDGKYEYSNIRAINFLLPVKAIRIYPNPVNQFLHIDGEYIIHIAIYSVDGKLQLETKETRSIDVSGLAEGIYTIRIRRNNVAPPDVSTFVVKR